MFSRKSILALTVLILVACNKSDNKSSDPLPPPPPPAPAVPAVAPLSCPASVPSQAGLGPNSYEYFGMNDAQQQCTTQKHQYTNLQEYCALLINEAANANCARAERQRQYAMNCSSCTQNNQPVTLVPKEAPVDNRMFQVDCLISNDSLTNFYSIPRPQQYSFLWSARQMEVKEIPHLFAGRTGSFALKLFPATEGVDGRMELQMTTLSGMKRVLVGKLSSELQIDYTDERQELETSVSCRVQAGDESFAGTSQQYFCSVEDNEATGGMNPIATKSVSGFGFKSKEETLTVAGVKMKLKADSGYDRILLSEEHQGQRTLKFYSSFGSDFDLVVRNSTSKGDSRISCKTASAAER